MLATGGVGGLFSVTTNPAYARGELIAMAARAGAVIGDAEFVQFHPTAIDVGVDPAPLATEALRGEGATLVNRRGERFMTRHRPEGRAQPARHRRARRIRRDRCRARRLPRLPQGDRGRTSRKPSPPSTPTAAAAGIDPATELIPVAPAAHYHMGGIATDALGRTSVPGLWAIGEVASTGLHGANRLASNSLLEAVVFAARAAGAYPQPRPRGAPRAEGGPDAHRNGDPAAPESDRATVGRAGCGAR